MTAQKKGTIIGTDAFFRELAVGDEIQDLDGRRYTIDQFGRCKPLDGGNVLPLSRINEPALVTRYQGPLEEKADGSVAPKSAPMQEPRIRLRPIAQQYGLDTFHAVAKLRVSGIETIVASGHTWIREADEPAARTALATRVTVSGPSGDVPTKEEVKNLPPLPEKPAAEPAERKGGRENKSGFCQVGNLARRFDMKVSEGIALFQANGIEIVRRGPHGKAHIHVEDLQKCRELLAKASGYDDPGNHGNHRPNLSGFVSFANLARSLKTKAWQLREAAREGGFAVVRPGTNAHRNDGISIEDEERFREYAAEHLPNVKSGGRPNESGLVRLDSIAKTLGVKGTKGWTQVLRDHGIEVVFIDGLNKQAVRAEDKDKAVEILRGEPDPVAPALPDPFPPLSQEVLDAIKEGSLAKLIEIHPRIGEFSDAALADELRRRGYEVTAIKHIEL